MNTLFIFKDPLENFFSQEIILAIHKARSVVLFIILGKISRRNGEITV